MTECVNSEAAKIAKINIRMDRNRSACLIMMNNTRKDKLMIEMTFRGVCSVNRRLKRGETLLSVNRGHAACFTIMYKAGGRGFRVRGKVNSF